MSWRAVLLAGLSLAVLAGCGGGGGGSKESGLTLGSATSQCSVESQPVSCTNPVSQTVTTITPVVAVTFTEPMNRSSVERNVEVIVDNLTDSVSVRNTVEGLVAGQLVAIAWNSATNQLTVTVLKVARQLENGKSYRVTATVISGQCVETGAGARICEGTLGPFAFQVRLP